MDELVQAIIPYIQLSKAIIERENIVTSESASRKEVKDAKEEIKRLEQKFDEDANDLVYDILSGLDGTNMQRLDSFFESLLGGMKQAIAGDGGADAEINLQAIERTSEKLTVLAAKQQKKSPTRRKIEHYGALIFLTAALVVYFSVRFFSAVPTYDEVETQEELLSAYSAVKKIDRYDDWMEAEVRKGGWLKGILLWPIKPTEDEINFAAEYLTFVVAVHGYGQQEGFVCDNTLSSPLTDADIETQWEYLHLVGDFAENADPGDYAAAIAAAALIGRYPCS